MSGDDVVTSEVLVGTPLIEQEIRLPANTSKIKQHNLEDLPTFMVSTFSRTGQPLNNYRESGWHIEQWQIFSLHP